MKSQFLYVLFSAILSFAARAQTNSPAGIEVLRHALSPSNTDRNRPLLDALDKGFNAVEVDLWLVSDALLVGGKPENTGPGRTLDSVYLTPLKIRVENHAGKVFPEAPPFTLLLNFHSEAGSSYAALKKSIERFESILTRFTRDGTEPRAITIIVSGNTPREIVRSEPVRYVGIEGRINDLNESFNPNLVPMIGDDWNYWFRWDGETMMNEEQRARLKQAVDVARHYRTRLRFLNAPDTPFAWFEFHRAGVDFISSTDLEGLRDFLKRTYQRERSLETFRKANEQLRRRPGQ